MKRTTLHLLCSPSDKAPLALRGEAEGEGHILSGRLSSTKDTFEIVEGIPDLVYPPDLQPSDERFRAEYDKGAKHYQEGMDWLFSAFYTQEADIRRQMAAILAPENQERILVVGGGTGQDARYFFELASQCTVILTDISIGMLKEAQKNLADFEDQVDLLLCNGAWLPFQDATFDRVFHFGGINEFGEKERAILEFTRVVKPGGKVVFGDEGIAPWLANKEYGNILKAANPLYAHQPPLDLLPENASTVRLHWILGNAFYLIEFEKASHPPQLNKTLPIPGKRGGTLQSRYEDHQSH